MGKTNILQHKSWHVYNRDNVEKVRRDEENARLEQEEKDSRIAFAEQEARTEALRKKAGIRGPERSNEGAVVSHFNLFFDEQRAQEKANQAAKDKHTAIEQQAWEKKVGILKQLGEGSKELGTLPWYEDIYKNDAMLQKKKRAPNAMHDPLTRISEYLEAKHPSNDVNKRIASKTSMTTTRPTTSNPALVDVSRDADRIRVHKSAKHAKDRDSIASDRVATEDRYSSTSKRKRSGKDKKEIKRSSKKDKRHKSDNHSSNGSNDERRSSVRRTEKYVDDEERLATKALRLAKLREESALRVADDRKRIRELVQTSNPIEEQRRYNSQFNPQFARQTHGRRQ
eukprot:CFRG3303T1